MNESLETSKDDLKNKIIDFAKDMGVDDIGFASVKNYESPNSIPINELFPDAKTIIVLAFQQIDNCESENEQFASVGIKIVTEFSHETTYRLASFIKKQFKARAMAVPGSGPVTLNEKTGLPIGYVSLRHAALAAGLGNFGNNNLIIHPEMGSKVVFTAIVTDMEIEADKPVEKKICIDCDICVKKCPVHALDEENKTNVPKCAFNSQPYGVHGNTQFMTQFIESSPEEQKKMLQDDRYKKLYQALALGSQYVCFNCTKNCPIGS